MSHRLAAEMPTLAVASSWLMPPTVWQQLRGCLRVKNDVHERPQSGGITGKRQAQQQIARLLALASVWRRGSLWHCHCLQFYCHTTVCLLQIVLFYFCLRFYLYIYMCICVCVCAEINTFGNILLCLGIKQQHFVTNDRLNCSLGIWGL